MAAGATVSVVIANWNGAAYLPQCLDAVRAQSLAPGEVLVVDNGSTDGSVALIADGYPDVRLTRLPVNEGTARAWNRAIDNTRGDYVLILNTDVFLDRDFLCSAVNAASSSDNVGLVAARILDERSGRVQNAGQVLQRRLRVRNRVPDTEPARVFSGSGSALLCRRAMLADIRLGAEYFDESFFAYWEDVDLAWRAQLRGWDCVYEPGAAARHVGSASQGGRVRVLEKSPFFQRHIWKNRYLVLIKNASPGVVLALFPWLTLAEILSWVYLLVRAPRRLPIYLAAHHQVMRVLPSAVRKRRQIQRRRQVGARRILRHFVGF